MIKNFPISVEDANNALEIYGPSIASLKSKTVRRTPEVVVTDIVMAVYLNESSIYIKQLLFVLIFILMACAVLVVSPLKFSMDLCVVLLVAKTSLKSNVSWMRYYGTNIVDLLLILF